MFPIHNNNFDLIRLIAAVQVMLVHYYQTYSLDFGLLNFINYFPGIPIFFLISGFLVSMSFENTNRLKDYYLNRFLRIYPGLILSIIIGIILIIFSDYHIQIDHDFFLWIFSQLSIFQFFNPEFLRGYGTGVFNGVLWAISVEMTFYLLLPLLYYVSKKTSNINTILLILIFFSALIDYFYINHVSKPKLSVEVEFLFKLLSVSILPYLWMFLIGIFLQRNWKYFSKVIFTSPILYLIIYIIFLIIAYNIHPEMNMGNHPNIISFILLSCFIMSLSIYSNGGYQKFIGGFDISYGIYLYHALIMNFYIHNTLKLDLFVLCLITFSLAVFSWIFVEKYALSFKVMSIKRKL